jgi:ABC-type nitrate/sulfonate/bicarbonate transport system substrate-binding protein
MSLVELNVMYGHLEGAGKDFARDPTGLLSIQAGIFQRHGLAVSWQHVQGTEERYRRLEDGRAQLSLLVGRASLPHFLNTKSTRILGCAMNSCPYYLVGAPTLNKLADLRGKIVACRQGPARNTPIAETFYERAQLRVGTDLELQLPSGDQDAFNLLIDGKAQAALLPRPFGFIAEERGFKRLSEWPEIVDDPLPITIETTTKLLAERQKDFIAFLNAHSEGIHYFKSHRAEALEILTKQFGHAPALAQKTFDDYIVRMDETLKVDFKHFEKLLAQIAPEKASTARQVASEWIVGGAMKE